MPESAPIQYASRAIISPSISSVASRSDEADAERRRELSPSPEVDLSSTEFEEEDMVAPGTPSTSFSSRRVQNSRNHRATSPPLEKDEKEFTQTARGMQRRQMSRDDTDMPSVPSEMADHPTKTTDHDGLFGRSLTVASTTMFVSSPAMKPSLSLNTMKRSFEDSPDSCIRFENTMDWDMRSPENVELEELDGMLDDF